MSDGRSALRFQTMVPLNALETFLDKECRASWSLKLEGIADDLNQKVVVISFDDANDIARFKAGYKSLKAQYSS